MKVRLLIMLSLFLPLMSAQATEIHFRASTFVSAAQEHRSYESVLGLPMLELVTFELEGFDFPVFERNRIVLDGWARVQLGDDELDDHDGDVRILYYEGGLGPFTLRLGRQHVFQGTGRTNLIDGAQTSVQTSFGLIAEGHFGATVNRRFSYDRGDWQGGGRLAYRLPVSPAAGPGEVGVSYAHSRRSGSLSREDIGADFFYWVGPVRLLGAAALSPSETRLREGRLAANIRVVDELLIAVDYDHTEPDLFISRSSIFSVFAETRHDSIGTSLFFEPTPYWGVDVGFHAIMLSGDWLGYDTELGLYTYREPTHRSVIGLEAKRHAEDQNGYIRGRGFTALQVLEDLRASADLFVYRYDEPINGGEASVLGQTSLSYDLGESMTLVGNVAAGATPYADWQVEGMIRFVYGFDLELNQELGE